VARSGSIDHDVIIKLIPAGARVLDLGAGDGTLLARLRDEKDVVGTGIDRDEDAVLRALSRDVPIIRLDLDTDGLSDFADKGYDYVILSRTLQEVRKPGALLDEMLRVAQHAVVSFPNFGYLTNRLQFFFYGTMPQNDVLPIPWYETPNIHFCTRRDFRRLCRRKRYRVEQEIAIGRTRRLYSFTNVRARHMCYVLSRTDAPVYRSGSAKIPKHDR
jgi:methionine biosynthesis protein MetW